MATITDFDSWLDQADPDDYEEIYALYRTVADADEFGLYKCSVNNGKYFVKADHAEDTLMLASEKARSAFLQAVDSRYDIEGDIEGWYGYQRAMDKDD
ncbi:hypothetical protein [Pectobacterium aroidearum]|uniref:hypothetical protein n=1 Tax=Pectobacterium aroidearum TaxID=1201031 RepID=UPI002A80A17A|nr:hypothetical protein [Pectobacterium aroidearum]MDY4388687.1 hypothetical protein [Pectobacterium aroidearum]